MLGVGRATPVAADEQLASMTERAGHRQRSLQNGLFVLFKEMSLDLGALAGFRHKRLTQLIYKTIGQTIAAFAALFVVVQERIKGFREIFGSLAHYFIEPQVISFTTPHSVAAATVEPADPPQPSMTRLKRLCDCSPTLKGRTSFSRRSRGGRDVVIFISQRL